MGTSATAGASKQAMRLALLLLPVCMLMAQTPAIREPWSGHLKAARQSVKIGRFVQAELFLKVAVDLIATLPAGDPERLQVSRELAESQRLQGKYADARQSLLAALGTEAPGIPQLPILADLTRLNFASGDLAEAERWAEQALAIQEKQSPNSLDLLPALSELARVRQARGQKAEVEMVLLQMIRLREEHQGPDHADLAPELIRLARFYVAQKRFAVAEPVLLRAAGILQEKPVPDTASMLSTLTLLASTYRQQEKMRDAEQTYLRAIATAEALYGPVHQEVGQLLDDLATLRFKAGRFDEAAPLYERSLALWKVVLGEDHLLLATSLDNLAVVYAAQNKLDQAAPLYEKALAIRERDELNSLMNTALLATARQKYAEADTAWQRILVVLDRLVLVRPEMVAEPRLKLLPVLENYADLLTRRNRPVEAARVRARITTLKRTAVKSE